MRQKMNLVVKCFIFLSLICCGRDSDDFYPILEATESDAPEDPKKVALPAPDPFDPSKEGNEDSESSVKEENRQPPNIAGLCSGDECGRYLDRPFTLDEKFSFTPVCPARQIGAIPMKGYVTMVFIGECQSMNRLIVQKFSFDGAPVSDPLYLANRCGSDDFDPVDFNVAFSNETIGISYICKIRKRFKMNYQGGAAFLDLNQEILAEYEFSDADQLLGASWNRANESYAMVIDQSLYRFDRHGEQMGDGTRIYLPGVISHFSLGSFDRSWLFIAEGEYFEISEAGKVVRRGKDLKKDSTYIQLKEGLLLRDFRTVMINLENDAISREKYIHDVSYGQKVLPGTLVKLSNNKIAILGKSSISYHLTILENTYLSRSFLSAPVLAKPKEDYKTSAWEVLTYHDSKFQIFISYQGEITLYESMVYE